MAVQHPSGTGRLAATPAAAATEPARPASARSGRRPRPRPEPPPDRPGIVEAAAEQHLSGPISHRRTRTRPRWWLLAPACGFPVAVLAVTLPGGWGGTLTLVVQLAVLVVLASSLLRRRPADRAAWALVLTGLLVWTTADLVSGTAAARAAPSLTGLLVLTQYPLLAAALLRLARDRGPIAPGLIVDAGLIIGAGSIGGWLLVIAPHTSEPDASVAALVTACAYLVMDLIVAGAVLRLTAAGPRPPGDHLLLALAATALLAADIAHATTVAHGLPAGSATSRAADLLWLVWAVVAATAALHPGAPGADRPWTPRPALSRRRLLLFAALALLIPVAPATVRGAPTVALVPAGLGALVATLLVVRLGMLAAQVGRAQDALAYAQAQREALREELRHQASHDPLTGLASRVTLTACLTGESHRKRESLILIDLDRFADINDAHGHAVGDDVLTQVAARLRSTMPAARVLARLDGDEFAVLQTGDGAAAARRALAALRPSYRVGGRELHVTASAGVVDIRNGRDAVHALRNADLALDEAKSAGRDRAVTFRPELREALLRRSELADSLRHAADRGELELAYQPVVDLETGRMVAAEALMRWRRGGESVPPDQFIPLAEQTGLIIPLGWWALGEACRQARRWYSRHGIAVTVNVSAHQLRETDFVERVLAALAEAELPGDALVLELTESMLITDADAAEQALHRLRAHGVRIAVDDFGTGYSSLSYLIALPVDILKLDRAFVASDNERQYAITGAVLQLADVLRLATIAEGVETTAQADALRGLGCPLAQGYLYAPAVPAPAVDSLLARWNPSFATS